MEIGNIGNFYGGLEVEEKDGKYFWVIADCTQRDLEEIPKYVYIILVHYENERRNSEKLDN